MSEFGVPDEILTCDGVTLRRWRHGDAALTFALVNDTIEHLAPWMEFAANGYTEADAVAYLALCDEHWDSRRNFNYAIVAPDGRVVGSTGIMTERPEGGVEIGYWLHRDYTGQGIATKASRAQIEAAWLMGATHVIIVHDSNNHRSGAVPARLGFTEVERRVGVEPPTAVKTGTKVVWRLDRK